MNSADMREVWNRLAIQDGDIIFVDANAVDMAMFEGLDLGVAVTIFPVEVPAGKSINDCVLHVTREEVSAMQGCKL